MVEQVQYLSNVLIHGLEVRAHVVAYAEYKTALFRVLQQAMIEINYLNHGLLKYLNKVHCP